MILSDFVNGKEYKIKDNAKELCSEIWNVPKMDYLRGRIEKCIGITIKGMIKIRARESIVGYWTLPPEAFEECEQEALFDNNTPEALAFQKLLKGKIA